MHIASRVVGTLAPGRHAVDALAATFPAGTLTGAPKIRAMEIIEDLEPVRRGAYGGAVGYLDFAGNLDVAIAIRTAVVANGMLHVQAGAGHRGGFGPRVRGARVREQGARAHAGRRAGGGVPVILVVDNYDSFTFNLVQILATLDPDVVVVRNDALTVDEILAKRPDRLVVSPGPGRPEDAGVSCALIERNTDIPLLGVCLGHQALGAVFGGRVSRAPTLMHGKTSEIAHDGRGALRGALEPVHGDALPLARGRGGFGAGGAARDGEDVRRDRHGPRPPDAAARRRPVPPGVDPDDRGGEAPEELRGGTAVVTPVHHALREVARGGRLSREDARRAVASLLDDEVPPAVAGGFLASLAAAGETIEVLAGAVDVLRSRATRLPVPELLAARAIDVCGTGGDGHGTFNVSTAAAFVVAGAGTPVAKHGNRAVSSKCGSADVLAALGVVLEMTPERAAAALVEREHHVSLRAALPPGHEEARAAAPGAGCPHGLQPRRAALEPGGGAPADRRRRPARARAGRRGRPPRARHRAGARLLARVRRRRAAAVRRHERRRGERRRGPAFRTASPGLRRGRVRRRGPPGRRLGRERGSPAPDPRRREGPLPRHGDHERRGGSRRGRRRARLRRRARAWRRRRSTAATRSARSSRSWTSRGESACDDSGDEDSRGESGRGDRSAARYGEISRRRGGECGGCSRRRRSRRSRTALASPPPSLHLQEISFFFSFSARSSTAPRARA